ncbi:MAG: tryptophan 7-halogenase [Pseudomonadota bacterium]
MRSARTRSLQTIAIVGAGFEGTLAALWLGQACRGTGIRIVLAPCPGAEACDFAYATLPARPDDLLGALGISDLTLLQACSASFALGVALGDHTLPFGSVGMDFAGADFHHHWLLTDRQESYFAYSPAWQAMQGAQFAPPVARNAIGSLQHEFTRLVDVPALVDLLSRQFESRGIRVTAPIDSNQWSPTHNAHKLVFTDSESLDADIVIDASGSRSDGESPWLHAQSEDTVAPLPTYKVEDEGPAWLRVTPLADRTILTRFDHTRSSASRTPWEGNVVRIGAAAHALPPLLPWYSSLLMRSIRRLAEWLPPSRDLDHHRRAFNRQFAADVDLLASANALVETALGRPSDATPEAALSLWCKRGAWHDPDSDLLNRWDWIGLLMALNHYPQNHDPLAERLPAKSRTQHCARLRAEIVRITSGFPKLTDYLAAAQQAGQ